ncbi:MAG: hypothetical protein ABJO09_01440 [Hyphomicrobiales bacterium]
MAKRPKSWREKLTGFQNPVRKPVPKNMVGMKKGEMMLIPTPQLIKEFVEAIPEGKSMNLVEMRKAIAESNDSEVTCPITTGFHLRTVVEATFEDHEEGLPLEAMTPVWRVLDEKAPTLKKLSDTQRAAIAKMRKEEQLDSKT